MEEGEVQNLEIHSMIGFDGAIFGGLRIHPDGKHLIYPIGNKVSVFNLDTKKQDFLSGHSNIISAVDVSRSGEYVASGQVNQIGFKTWVIVWDFKKRTIIGKHEVHKVRIEAVKFSCDDRYVTSLSGRNCGTIVVWDIATRSLLSNTDASNGSKGYANTLCMCNVRGPCFITGGNCTLTIWGIDVNARSISGIDVNMPKLKRIVYCMDIDDRDEYCYCGTSSGDVLKIRLNFHNDLETLLPISQAIVQGCFTRITRQILPKGYVKLYGLGVTSLIVLPNGNLLIGAGDGTIDIVEETEGTKSVLEPAVGRFELTILPVFRMLKSTNVKSFVTSLQLVGKHKILAGTRECDIFIIDKDTFELELIATCHYSAIYCIAFPYKFSEVFATGGKGDVRIWSILTMQELLRIKVPNFSCSAIEFSHDGKAILTGWNDAVIRSFTPLSGKPIFSVLRAHNKAISALAITHHGRTLVSGGCDGQVRLWDLTPHRQHLTTVLKEHNAPISEIHINETDLEAVSAGTDGCCIIWDIERKVRKQILFSNTFFMCVRYFPTGAQILTGDGDRKLGYWEVYNGNLIREIEGSISGAINSLDISCHGELFVSGGNDQIVRLWKYTEGITTHIGLGHSAVISGTRFSPDSRFIVTVSAAGSIFVWKNPYHSETNVLSDPTTVEPIKEINKTKTKSTKIISSKEENIENLPSVRLPMLSMVHSPTKDNTIYCPCVEQSSKGS